MPSNGRNVKKSVPSYREPPRLAEYEFWKRMKISSSRTIRSQQKKKRNIRKIHDKERYARRLDILISIEASEI
jgi:hypothetical protein